MTEATLPGPLRARRQGYLDIDHIPELRARYVRGSRSHQPASAATLAAEYGVTARDIRGAAQGTHCQAGEGTAKRCRRSGELRRGLCNACSQWSLAHGGTVPPPDRPRYPDEARVRARPRGAVMVELRAAAYAATDDCIDYTGHARRPHVHVGRRWMQASRATWIIRYGDPGDLFVLHTCHRGWEGCINIRHLYLGDRAQNIQDMVDAGRQQRGTRCHMAKLDEWKVREIRRRYTAGGISQSRLGAEYGVSQLVIYSLLARKTWAWVTDEDGHVSAPPQVGDGPGHLTECQGGGGNPQPGSVAVPVREGRGDGGDP